MKGWVAWLQGRPARCLLAGAFTAVALCPTAWSSTELAQQQGCFGCHAVDKEVVGPAYVAVARRYKGRPDAEATLVAHIKTGGSGRWGPAPMPAQAQLTDADALKLARWILGLAK